MRNISKGVQGRSGAATRCCILAIWCCWAWSSGCGGSRGEASRFPTQAELQKIEQAPPPSHFTDSSVREVETWDLVDPPADPSPTANHAPQSLWERQLARDAERRQGLLWLSEPMHCLARQTGAFYLANEGLPGHELQQFMASRCGVLDTEIASAYQTVTGAENATDDQLYATTNANIETMVNRYLMNGTQAAGIWEGRAHGRMVAMLVYAPRRMRAEQVPSVPDSSGHFTLRGELLEPAENLDVLINKGAYGYATCERHTQVKLPRFEVDCQGDPHDPSAWIELAAFPPGRVLGRVVGSWLAWPAGTVANRYVRSSQPSVQGAAASGPTQTMIHLLNQVRKDAGLAPVQLADEESATATRVAPHFFAAQIGVEPELVADQVVLGLRAGWQVKGMVNYGHFVAGMESGDNGPARLLSAVLSRPSGRETLLDSSIRFVAIGAVKAREQPVTAAVFASYSVMDVVKPDERAKIVQQLTVERNKRGLPAPVVVQRLEQVIDGEMHRLETGNPDWNGALENVLHRVSEASAGQAVRGWFMTANRLEAVPFPEELLTARQLKISVGVAHYRPAGEPWGVYGVVVVATQSAPGMQASRPSDGEEAVASVLDARASL
jgi:hypothetical protein